MKGNQTGTDSFPQRFKVKGTKT